MRCCSVVSKNFERFALRLDEEISIRSLTNIPVPPWRVFKTTVHVHLVLAAVLFITGSLCFCIGMQFSVLYDAVNCSDGTNIFPPMLNLISSFCGLFACRTPHLKWPAFIHSLSVVVVFPLNLLTAVDLAVTSAHWNDYWSRYPPEDKPQVNTFEWSILFLWMDIAIALIALLNDVVCGVLTYIYYRYWLTNPNHRDRLPYAG